MNHTRMHLVAAMSIAIGMALAACEQKGPVEQAGEEVDEAVDTLKSGEESTATKLDDAADEVREGANNAADEVKSK